MDGGHTLVLVLTVWLVSIPMIVTFGNSDYHEQAQRKLANENPGFISIDCGAAEDYYENDTGIFYQSDAKFIDTGTIMTIPSDLLSSEQVIRQQLKNLRSFPQGRKNCYTLKPEQGKNHTYMIRAFFNYGNYDGKSQAPVFDLYLGINKWDTVNSPTLPVPWKDIIHFSLTDNIYVCLVNTGFGIPFISALELRLLNNSIYKIESGALQLVWRKDVGGSYSILRYPDDIYDRIWVSLDPSYLGGHLVSIDSTIDTQISNGTYYPPQEVLRTTAQSQNSSTPLKIQNWDLDTSTLEYYVYFHFAEIEDGQLRELNISLNGEFILTEPIQLEYLKPVTVGPLHLPTGTGFSFSIYATNESNLPPILNAFETYVLRMLPNSPTDLEEVDAIMDIKQVYRVTRNWQGDPCVPSAYSWDGLKCSNNNPSRIISLITSRNLASSRLTGKIASSLSNLKSLESLDLSNNSLTGPVPEFLAQLPSLRTLSLTGNELSGSIPQAFMEKVKGGSFNLRRKKQGESNKEGSLKSANQEFTYSEVVSMTDNFKTVIGEGGFGKVYLGTLKNGNLVAVKLRSPLSKQGLQEFRIEAQLLMRVHHKNLVSLIGYCNEGKNMGLVYEYMTMGNLRELLSDTNTRVLSWQKRLQIAVDAAQGLEYLHNGCKRPIIHRDVKTSNILLNEKLQAKIADFGLSRDLKNEGDTHVFTDPAGTPAYIDPEYHKTGKLNKKSDVFSFGIVLLELITGQRSVITCPEHIQITQWVRPIIERGDIQNIVDQRLQGDFNTNSAWKAVEIAISCVPSTAIQRPDMSHVVAELKECLAIETQRMVSSKTRKSNSHEMTVVDLETEIDPR